MAARGREVDRARHVAVKELGKQRADQQRSSMVIKAVEVRLNGSSTPDVSFHIASGSQSQGGYLFFVEDLLADVERPKTVV